MSVKNVLDETIPLNPSAGITDIELTYNTASSSSLVVNSYYVKNGTLCTLYLPQTVLTGTNGGLITITIPNAIIPSQSIAFYRVSYTYGATTGYCNLRLASGSNVMTISSVDSSLNEGNFSVNDLTISPSVYITYQTN